MNGSSIWNKIAFGLLAVVAVAIAAGTIVEKQCGTETALHRVYTSWWMCALWALLAVAGMVRCLQARMWRRPTLLLLHISLVVILAGAFVTHLTSRRGYVYLRLHEATCAFITPDRGAESLPFYLCLDTFRIDTDASTGFPQDYVSQVLIHDASTDRHVTISMNHPARHSGYRIYQTSYDDDLRGSIFTVMHDPWGIRLTYLGYALLALSMILLSLRRRRTNTPPPTPNTQYPIPSRQRISLIPSRQRIATLVQLTVGLLFASYMVVGLLGKPLMPVLRSPMLFIHVGVIMVSYCLLVVSFFNRRVLRLAVFMLAAGIFLGAVWANLSWGTYWSWDPKESWALVTLIIYALPLHTESLPWFRSQSHYRWYSLVAILSLLMTYFGVNYLLGGMHSYM